MCLQDLQIDRTYRTRCYKASNQVLNIPANPLRVGLRVCYAGLSDSNTFIRTKSTPVDSFSASLPICLDIIQVVAPGGASSIFMPSTLLTLANCGDLLLGPLEVQESGGETVHITDIYTNVETDTSMVINKL